MLGEQEIGYSIVLTEQDIDHIKNRYSESFHQKIMDEIDEKQRQLQWIDNVQNLHRRFWNFVGSNHVHFPEMEFSHKQRDYRAVFITWQQTDCIVFHNIVKKDDCEDSRQNQVLVTLQNNPQQFRKKAEEKLNQGEIVIK